MAGYWHPEGKGRLSADEYALAVLENLTEVLSTYPYIDTDIKDIDLPLLENLKPGTYRVNDAPPVELLKQMPFYRNCTSEIGVVRIQNQWLLILHEENKLSGRLPFELNALLPRPIFQKFMHSHPAIKEEHLGQPSINDLDWLDHTVDGAIQIIAPDGLTQISKGNNMEFDDTFDYYLKKFRNYVVDELKLTEEKFFEIGERALMKSFCEKYLNEIIIPYDDVLTIEKIMKKNNDASRTGLNVESNASVHEIMKEIAQANIESVQTTPQNVKAFLATFRNYKL